MGIGKTTHWERNEEGSGKVPNRRLESGRRKETSEREERQAGTL